jgi:hypothetical protein
MQTEQTNQLPMIERMERALVLLAYFIELDGDVHLPMYQKFEAELAELKQKEETKDRARRLLLACNDKRNSPNKINLSGPAGSLPSRLGALAIKL